MSIHRLAAGDGYRYLTDQVAPGDVMREAGKDLAAYYAAAGNPPGAWVGSGLDALGLSGLCQELQMARLFGGGCHPETGEALGQAYRRYPGPTERARVKVSEMEEERSRGGLPPLDPVEVAAIYAEERRRGTPQPTAGWDLTFSPVKSVSLLYAFGGPQVRGQVEAAHEAAWRDTLAWIESQAALSRVGSAAGRLQVETEGLVAAAYQHRDSRCGDPDLHTHVVLSNKVRLADGRWRSLDARTLLALSVSASERYNSRLEDQLVGRLGVRFTDSARPRRPVREVEAIPEELLKAFSSRRRAIESRLVQLHSDYRAAHGREPTPKAALRLAQQATIETRPRKELRSLGRQLSDWAGQAEGLGYDAKKREEMLAQALRGGPREPAPAPAQLAGLAMEVVATERSTWTEAHVRAEVERQARPYDPGPSGRDALVEEVVAIGLSSLSICLTPAEAVPLPAGLAHADGGSPLRARGSTRYTSAELLRVEADLVAAGAEDALVVADPVLTEAAIALVELDPEQAEAVRRWCSSGRRLDVMVGPAGSGKTRTMAAVARAFVDSGHSVLALAPSAVAARELGQAISAPAETLARLLHLLDADQVELGSGQVLIVDEASMAATADLARIVERACSAGAIVRLVGDPHQLGAVGAGGAFRLLVSALDASELGRLHRFAHIWEALTTLRVRSGDPGSLGDYQAHGRLHHGERSDMLARAFSAWNEDFRAGRDALLLVSSRSAAATLNAQAQGLRRLAGELGPEDVEIAGGAVAAVGDRVVARHNDRRLAIGASDFVRNGLSFEVTAVLPDGGLRVSLVGSAKAVVDLPASYVRAHVQLAYASTIHSAQGRTVDRAHVVLSGLDSRAAAYVGLSRAREGSILYLVTEGGAVGEEDHHKSAPPSAREVWERVMASTEDAPSATDSLRVLHEEEGNLALALAAARWAATEDALARVGPIATEALGERRGEGLLRRPEERYRLAELVAVLEAVGADATRVIAERAKRFPEADASELAQCEPLPGRLLPTRGVVPRWRARDEATDAYLKELVVVAAARAEALGRGVLAERPAWALRLGRIPEDPLARAAWVGAAEAVASFREAFAVVDERPLGGGGRGGLAGRARQAARQAIVELDQLRAPGAAAAEERLGQMVEAWQGLGGAERDGHPLAGVMRELAEAVADEAVARPEGWAWRVGPRPAGPALALWREAVVVVALRRAGMDMGRAGRSPAERAWEAEALRLSPPAWVEAAFGSRPHDSRPAKVWLYAWAEMAWRREELDAATDTEHGPTEAVLGARPEDGSQAQAWDEGHDRLVALRQALVRETEAVQLVLGFDPFSDRLGEGLGAEGGWGRDGGMGHGLGL